MAQLHDVLKEDNYTGHYLEVFLIRIIFCLYAEDLEYLSQSIL